MNFVTKEQAKNGAECRWRKYNMVTSVAIACIFLLIFTPIFILLATVPPQVDLGALITVCVIFVLMVFGPFGGIFIYQYVCYRRVINAATKCPVYRVTLDNPHGSYLYRGGVIYYTVEFETDGGRVKIDTTAIFATYGWFVPFEMSEYNNKDVYIMYDSEREKVYVIDLVEKIDK